MSGERHPARAFHVGLAFAAVYGIWGSTYYAIRVAVAEFEPFVMAALRFVVAGVALYAFLRLRGAPRPTRAQWINATRVGFLLLACSNAAVTFASRSVPSGLVALLCAILPMWMVLLEYLGDRSRPPSAQVIGGVAMGVLGVVILFGPGIDTGGGGVDLFGAGLVIGGSLTWALGSLQARKVDLPKSAPMSTAMQMIAGGVVLTLAAGVHGDWGGFRPAEVSLAAWLALIYLAVFGSLIALSAYVWLLQVSTPARVSTYAYVNPVVAVALGWAIGDEALDARTLLAGAIIIGAVVVITTQRGRGQPPRKLEPATE